MSASRTTRAAPSLAFAASAPNGPWIRSGGQRPTDNDVLSEGRDRPHPLSVIPEAACGYPGSPRPEALRPLAIPARR